jgi:hypothetical protein
MGIINAKDKNLYETNDLPDVSGGVNMFLQSIKLGMITKKQIAGYTHEFVKYVYAKAVRQAFTTEQLILRPEGERSWKWYTLHMTPEFQLKTDDIIIIYDMRMRIMERLDYLEYGFIEYHAIEDFSKTQVEIEEHGEKH